MTFLICGWQRWEGKSHAFAAVEKTKGGEGEKGDWLSYDESVDSREKGKGGSRLLFLTFIAWERKKSKGKGGIGEKRGK